ncbi:MAG: amidohydrolase family protein [Lachnospiraceae bacterium]|nr:amidohydrolase family protein [Lachnospiraceae bacterium]MCI9486001.1 amidohydrolase family protein [Lachnospiraceae bacterium]
MNKEYSLLIKNGRIIDGNGTPAFSGDVLVKGDRIAKVGGPFLEEIADEVIDAGGKVVSPGLIDSHSHADLDLLKNPGQEFDLCQGVTTEIVGLCGLGFVPLGKKHLEENMKYSAGLFGYDPALLDHEFSSFEGYMKEAAGAGINVAVAATHNAARIAASGFYNRAEDRERRLRVMGEIVDEAMAAGCIGMSTGLSYYPCTYADFDELVFLAKRLRAHDGTFLTHIRYPRQGEPDSAIDEIIRVGQESRARIHILHYRTKYPHDHGHPERLLEKIAEANEGGCDFTLETLPYLSGSTFIHTILPGWVVEGGFERTLENLRNPALRPRIREEMQYLLGITAMGNGKPPRFGHVGGHPEYGGRLIRDVQAERGQELDEMLLDLLVESKLDINYVGNETEEDPEIFRILMRDTMTLLRSPLYLCGGDAMPYGEYPHPRTYGCYAKMLRLSREMEIPLESVVAKLTSCVADRFRLDDIGRLEPGKRADIIIFDPDTVTDRATFEEPTATATGIRFVIVGGKTALKDDKPTGVRNGSVVRKTGPSQKGVDKVR